MAPTQRCAVCESEHGLSAFGINARTGRRNKSCRKAIQRSRRHALDGDRLKKWRAKNRQRVNATAVAWCNRNRARRRANQRAWHERNREQCNARLRAARAANPQHREYMKAWFDAHPGYKTANTKAWRKKYPDRAKVTDAQMAAKRRAAEGTVTAAEWARIVLFYGHKCGQCRKARPLTVDHFRPLTKGGSHTWDNVWPLCMPCNARKHTTVPTLSAPPHVAVLSATAVAI